MGSVTVTIPGRPMPCPRPRVTGKRTYMPDSYLAWKTMASVLMRDAVVKQRGGRLMEGDVSVEAQFWGAHGSADIDNLLKSVLDAAQGQVFKNDKQVTHLEVFKVQLGDSNFLNEPETHVVFAEEPLVLLGTASALY